MPHRMIKQLFVHSSQDNVPSFGKQEITMVLMHKQCQLEWTTYKCIPNSFILMQEATSGLLVTTNGATFANIDVLKNPVNGMPMLLFEDNGGGMTLDHLRQCMSFGYSVNDTASRTIGQYGNGFKTSTMRLGADVIVFSKSNTAVGDRFIQSVGLLSYSFLCDTVQQDIIVPMLDYEGNGLELKEIHKCTHQDWKICMDVITKWSPYQNEGSIHSQFKKINDQGTRIIIYNLWENDEQQIELDFKSDPHDIQIRNGQHDIQCEMAKKYSSIKHFFLYKVSLRVYISMLYLHLPKNFKITLRNQEVEHSDIRSDAMHIEHLNFKFQNDLKISAKVHFWYTQQIDIQGFNVYHKNRLIKEGLSEKTD
ncbi:hypothetical protein SELMODRAFT_403001 [Selaginella moellendorffii]|uniref:Morc S5 domain-containing protein n=1 Tax=Selaginella moellendorffii TaxID=88036 RepID=D8QNR0_SELML|nr:hypothetical protein SELMODRAFT_403001 [Selaginella moellendorffii]